MGKSQRRNFFVNKRLQAKYVLLTFIFLLIYTFFFVCLLLAPYIYSLMAGDPLQEQAQAARMLLSLHETIWPILAVVILAMSCTTIYITHRIAGPVHRLKLVLAEAAAGNLNVVVKLREKDDLKELAARVNVLLDDLRAAVRTLDANQTTRLTCIDKIREEMAAGRIDPTVGEALIDKLAVSREASSSVLDKYQLEP